MVSPTLCWLSGERWLPIGLLVLISVGTLLNVLCSERLAFSDFLNLFQCKPSIKLDIFFIRPHKLATIIQEGLDWGVWYSLFIKNLVHFSSH